MTPNSHLNIYLRRTLYALILLIALLIPFNKSIPEIGSLIIFTGVLLFISDKSIKIRQLYKYRYLLIAAAMLTSWIIIRSIAIFSNEEISNIFRYTGILFLPLMILFFSTDSIGCKSLNYVLYLFIFASVTIALYSVIAAMITDVYWDVEFISLFPIKWYPGIMALSIPSIIFLITYQKLNLSTHILLWMALLLCTICIYLASRRGIILSVVGCLLFIAAIKLWSVKKLGYRIAVGAGLIILILTLTSNPRFEAIKDYDGYKYDIRLTMWETALSMIKKNGTTLMAGYGIEKGYKEYNARLQKIDYFPEFMKNNFNSSHNDFLDLTIMFGTIGLILFIALFLTGIYYSVKNKNLVFSAFVVMSVIQFFFGSYYFWLRTGKFSFFFLFSIFFILNDVCNHKRQKESR